MIRPEPLAQAGALRLDAEQLQTELLDAGWSWK